MDTEFWKAFAGKMIRKGVAVGVGFLGLESVIAGDVQEAVVTVGVAVVLMTYDWFKASWEARAKSRGVK